jgi:hypothetical protein
MVSDAASFPPWKSSHAVACSSINGGLPKELTFKKTRAKEISLDDSLEDTASSPVNSPKVILMALSLSLSLSLSLRKRSEINFLF